MADVSTLKNRFGNIKGWSKITLNWFGRDVEGVQSIEYDDEVKMDLVYGSGGDPLDIADGNYEPKDAKVGVLDEERLLMLEAIPKGTRIQDIAFLITVQYEYRDRIYTDIIKNCRFTNNGVKGKQGDTTMTHDFVVKNLGIEWNI